MYFTLVTFFHVGHVIQIKRLNATLQVYVIILTIYILNYPFDNTSGHRTTMVFLKFEYVPF